MQQTRHRSALGAAPIRPPMIRGINSRTQQTSTLLADYSTPAINAATLRGINSRTQQTARLLGEYARPILRAAPQAQDNAAARSAVRAGVQGLASASLAHGMGALGAHWMIQALATAAGTEFIGQLMSNKSEATELEEMAKAQEAAAKISNPFVGADRAGPSQAVVVDLRDRRMSPRIGLGSTGTTSVGTTAATTISSAAISSGSALASSSTWLAAAGGPIGLGVAGVTVALTYLFGRKRPQRKVATTAIVDEVEPLLKNNLDAYLAGPRTLSSQAQAAANFEAGWQFVVDNCGIPDMGEPGKWCINDRKRGGQWDWFARYLDPILNDAQVVADPPPGKTVTTDPLTGQRIVVDDTTSTEYQIKEMTPLLLALAGLGVVFYAL